jgi:hypothetical protein
MGSVVHGGSRKLGSKQTTTAGELEGPATLPAGCAAPTRAAGAKAMAARAAVPSATLRREVPAMPRAEPSVLLLEDVSLRGADEGAGLANRA